MGGCCSTLSSRDILTMLSAKLPTEPSKSSDRDNLFKKSCDLHRDETGSRDCSALSLVQAMQELYQIQKISNEIATVSQYLGHESALRYGDGVLNFKERRQHLARSVASGRKDEDATADLLATSSHRRTGAAGVRRTNLARHELRYALCYLIAYFRTKAIFEETAGLRFLSDPREAAVDEFSFRTAKRKLESEFRITIPAGGIALMHRETASAAALPLPKTDTEPIPLGSLVEHLAATLFYDELTTEDEPPREREPSRNASPIVSPAAAPSLTPAPPQTPLPAQLAGSSTSRGAGRQFGALLEEIESKVPEQPTPPAAEVVEEPRGPVPRTVSESPASTKGSEGGSQPRRRGSQQQRKNSRSSSRGSVQLPPPPISGAFGSTASKSSLSMWRSARALIPLGLTDEDCWARDELFDRFLQHAQKQKSGKSTTALHQLNEMDLFQGVQQHFMLKEIFPNGGLVVSQAVSSAFVSALHRLSSSSTTKTSMVPSKPTTGAAGNKSRSGTTTPSVVGAASSGAPSESGDGHPAASHTETTTIVEEEQEDDGIRSVSRFHVFLATLVALMDLHFALKRRMVKAEADRAAATHQQNAETLAKETHQRGPQAPNPLGAPSAPHHSADHHQHGGDISSNVVPLYEQNRIYQQTVGPVPLEMFLEVLMQKLVPPPVDAVALSVGDGDAIIPPVEEHSAVQSNAETTASSTALAAFQQISNAPMLPDSVLDVPRVSKMIEVLITGVRHSSTSTVAGPGGVPRVSLEKVGARIGVFICDALYLPRITVESKKADFLLQPEADVDRHHLLEMLNKNVASSDGGTAFTASESTRAASNQTTLKVNKQVLEELAVHLQLADMSDSADVMLSMAYSQALEFEHAARLSRNASRFPRNALDQSNDDDQTNNNNKAQHAIIDEDTLLSQPHSWYRFLLRLYATLTVAVAVELTRQPPLVELDDVSLVNLDDPITIKEWGHLCRSTFPNALGLKKLLATQDHFVIYHGLRRANDNDVVTTRAACQWATERVLSMLTHDAAPNRFQWYHVLTQRIPSATAEVDEPRCQSLFVRLTDGRDDAVLPSTHLAGLLGAAFGLHTLFDQDDVGTEGMWEAICKDAADASDAIAARRPSLVQEDTFRSCLCYLQGSMACYFTGERLLLSTGTAAPLSLTTLAVKKDALAELLRRLHLQDILPTADALNDEFASLSNGTASAELRHIAHFVGIMDLRKLPVRKLDVWKRIGPLLLQLVENDEQRMKFFTFGIQKDQHVMHCTALELQRAIGKDWCLDLLLGKAKGVAPLLRDAIGVANSTKYPPPKDTSIVTQDIVAPLLTFLYAYLDVMVASEEHMRVARSRRRSSAAAGSAMKVDEAAFLLLDDVFFRNGVRFHQPGNATTPQRQSVVSVDVTPSNSASTYEGPNKAALQKVFEVLKAADGTCSPDAIAHWAAHAAVRSRFSLPPSPATNSGASPRKVSIAAGAKSVASLTAALEASITRNYASSHPASPWTQLRAKLPIGTDARQSQRRSILFQQFDVTRRQSHLTPAELVDGAQWILGLDVFHVELAAVVHRAAAAAKDSLRAYFDGGSDGGLSKVSPQYAKSIKDALASPNVTPLEFRLVLVYLYQYLELYVMFDQLMGISAGLDGLLTSSSNHNMKDEAVNKKTTSSGAAEKILGSDLSSEAKRVLPKHITYQGFLKGGDLLVKWGLEEVELKEPDVLFRRINGGRDGVLLFSEFAAWSSREQLHIEDPDFGDAVI